MRNSTNRFLFVSIFSILSYELFSQQIFYIGSGFTGWEIRSVNLANCNEQLVSSTSNSIYFNDIAFSPSGKMYGITGSVIGIIGEISLIDGSFNQLITIPGFGGYKGMVCDNQDNLYVLDDVGDLLKYNISTNQLFNLGIIPNFVIAGDLTFYKGKLYGMGFFNDIWLIDLANPATSHQIFTIPYEIVGSSYGITSVVQNCDSTAVYAFTSIIDTITFETTNRIYKIDMETGQYTFVCNTVLEAFGGTSLFEFVAFDCQIHLNLDQNQSSQPTDSTDFNLKPNCNSATQAPIADTDLRLESGFRLDSMRISIVSGGLDVGFEQLAFSGVPNQTVTGAGTSVVRVRTTAPASATQLSTDYQTILSKISWKNTAASPTSGPRVVETIVFGGGQSDTAFTFIDFSLAAPTISTNQSICANDSLFFNQKWLKTAGIYKDTLPTTVGCDTILTLNLAVSPLVLSNKTASFCAGDSLFFNQKWLKTAGIYKDTLPATVGCDTILTLNLAISPLPMAEILGDSTFCAGDSTILFTQDFPKIKWSNGKTDPAITVSKSGKIYLKIENSSGCSAVDSINITELPIEKPQILTQNPSCFGKNDGQISWTSSANTLVFLENKSVPNDSSWQNLSAKIFQFRVETADGCTFDTTVSIENPSPLLLDLPANLTINQGDSVKIEPVLVNFTINVGQWSPQNWVVCPTCPMIFATPDTSGWLRFLATDSLGCAAIDSTFITILEGEYPIYAPTVISPNGDGLNDGFTFFAHPVFWKIREMQVFSRWGELVFSTKNITPNIESLGWNGFFRGKVVNPAVFTVTAILENKNGGQKNWAGTVTIIR
jgi:CHU_C Type IX secretion signal domain